MTMTRTATSRLKRTIDKELFEQWKRFFRQGDVKALVNITGKSKPTINNALKHGAIVDSDTIKAITDYFINRQTEEKKQTELLKSIK